MNHNASGYPIQRSGLHRGSIKDLVFDNEDIIAGRFGYIPLLIKQNRFIGAGVTGQPATADTAVAGKQAADADLTAIAALAPADDALIQRKAGAWTSRTPAQVKADMSIGVGDVSGLDENTRDVIGTALVAGSGVAVTVDDPGNTITIAVSGVVADAINDGTTTVAPSQNAVVDALSHLGINHVDMPATPNRVWRIINNNANQLKAAE